jgi:hypothetical protein
VNAFDWNGKNGFPEIMKAGGFDCVIGNPPWGADFSNDMNKYFQNSINVIIPILDSYIVFLIKSVELLTKQGILGFIIPDTFLRKDNYTQFRFHFLGAVIVNELIETGPVFSQVRDTWCVVINITNSKPNNAHRIHHKQINRFIVSAEERLEKFGIKDWDSTGDVKQIIWQKAPNSVFGYLINEQAQSIIAKIQNNHIGLGMLKELFVLSRGEEGSKFNLQESTNGNYYMVIPADISRYQYNLGVKIQGDSLTPNKIKKLYTHPKIWIIRIQKMRWKQRIVSTIDERVDSAGMKTLQIVVSVDDNIKMLKYLQAILSSRLINFYCINYLADDMNQSYLEKIPIPQIDMSKKIDKDLYESIISHVEQILKIKKSISESKTESDKKTYQQKADLLDRQIDGLVYELYGLTEEEIGIVEEKI